MEKTPHSVKLSKSEARDIKRAASKLGKSLSAFMADVAVQQAAKVLEKCPTCGKSHA
jgi:uncharacterized protein (DUF1778 family)